MKVCTKCGAEKPLSEFHRRHNGLQPSCKECRKATANDWYAKNRDAIRARRREVMAADPEPNREWCRRYHERHRVSENARSRERYAANPEPARQWQREYRSNNPEKVRASYRAWAAANPETVAKHHRLRRARKAEVEHQPYTRREIYDRDGGKCQACHKALPYAPRAFHIDHIVPIVLKGPDIPANLQVLCPSCNARKREKLEGQIHFAA